MKIADLLQEIEEVEQRFWFIKSSTLEQTDEVLKARLAIKDELFVHVFLSESSERFQLALINGRERIYGRDREDGEWHSHPYGNAETHVPMPEGVSPQPLKQFITEVEKILLENDLI